MRALAVILLLAFGGLSEGLAGTPELSTNETLTAKKLYVAKCAKCHKFYEPRNYNEAEWRKWMDSMSRKSKLKPEQDKLLNHYLDAYRSGTVAIAK